MLTFDAVDRDYETAKENFNLEIPEHFNFGFDVVDAWAERDANRTAFITVDATGESISDYSFTRLKETSNQFANALKNHGVERGEFACVLINRVAAWYEVMVGCMKLGVVSMPGTNLLSAKDIAYRIKLSEASLAIIAVEHLAKVQQIREECPSLSTVIVIGADAEDDIGEFLRYETIMAEASTSLNPSSVHQAKSSDLMVVYFTSGTTSLPKMVPRDYSYALAHVVTGLFWMDLKEGGVHWTLSDTGWAKAAWGMLFPQLMLGVKTVLYDGAGAFDPDLHLKLIEKLNVSTFCAPPTVYRVFAQMDLSVYNLSSIRGSLSAGEPLNPEVIRTWKEATGTMVRDGYGQTETVNIVANYPSLEIKPGSMGKPVPGFDVQIIDDKGKPVQTNEIGHIAMKVDGSNPPGLFNGYYEVGGGRNTKDFKHGWYYTGDTATRDEDGYIWFVGRSDDVITSSGYRISPFEVESSLLEHEAVAESAVIAVPDPMRTELVKACIVLADGFEPTEELKQDIQDFVKNHTAPYKYPRIVEFFEALPKTVSGKIRRVELRGEE